MTNNIYFSLLIMCLTVYIGVFCRTQHRVEGGYLLRWYEGGLQGKNEMEERSEPG